MYQLLYVKLTVCRLLNVEHACFQNKKLVEGGAAFWQVQPQDRLLTRTWFQLILESLGATLQSYAGELV